MGESTAKTAKTAEERNGRPAGASSGSAGSTRADVAVGATRAGTAVPEPRLVSRLITRLRMPRSPRLWFEVLLIGVSYWLYSLVRNAVPEQRAAALRHADWVWSFEYHIGLAVEHGVNHAVNSVTWLIVGMNYYYATLHFVITIGVLVWLYVRHPERYGPARLVIFVTTWLALIGFWAFPLAPPRLMSGKGFIDTVLVHHTWGSFSQGSLSHVSNQYAAMPSMHIGWSLWCGITIVTLAKPLWARVLGALYPLFTLSVIIATGNHFWLDAAGGAVCLGIGYALVAWLYGRWVYRLPPLPAVQPGASTAAR